MRMMIVTNQQMMAMKRPATMSSVSTTLRVMTQMMMMIIISLVLTMIMTMILASTTRSLMPQQSLVKMYQHLT